MSFAKYLTEARQRANISQAELSERIGKHYTYVSKIEKNGFVPPLESAPVIAKALRCSTIEVANAMLAESNISLEDLFGTKAAQASITPEEHKLLKRLRDIPWEQRKLLLDMLDVCEKSGSK
jgi:transcriptional regulator with XRE-family HTH domain